MYLELDLLIEQNSNSKFEYFLLKTLIGMNFNGLLTLTGKAKDIVETWEMEMINDHRC